MRKTLQSNICYRLVAAFLIAVMCIQISLPLLVKAEEKDQDGIIYINTAQDFVELASKCTTQSFSTNKDFVLNSDIDLSDYENTTVPYMDGVFDGRGHIIKGLNITDQISDCGLFRYVGANGAVISLSVSGNIISGDEQQHIGIIAGNNQGIISDCRIYGSLNAQNQVGGIVGYNQAQGIIQDCRNEADIDGKYQSGGIAGLNEGKISNCVNYGAVNTHAKIRRNTLHGNSGSVNISIPNAVTGFAADERANESGGIAGDSKGRITYCSNYGNVGYKELGSSSGGIAGRNSGRINGCKNEGIISGRQNIGGIVGYLDPYKAQELDRDYWQEFKGEVDNMSDSVKALSDAGRKLGDDMTANMDVLSGQVNHFKDTIRAYSDGYSDDISDARGELKVQADDIDETIDDMDYKLRLKQLKKYKKQLENSIENIEALLEELKKVAETGDDKFKAELGKIIEKYSQLLEQLKEILGRLEKVIEGGEGDNSEGISSDICNTDISVDDYLSSVSDNEVYDTVRIIIGKINDEFKTVRKQLHGIADVLSKWPKEAKKFRKDVKSIADDISNMYDVTDEYADRIDGRTDAMKSDIRPQEDAISNQLDTLRGDLDNDWNQVADCIDALRDNVKSVRTTLEDEKEELKSVVEEKSIYVDVSENTKSEEQDGSIVFCQNNGEVKGNSNIGGIAGSIDINDTKDAAIDIFHDYRNMNDDDEEEEEKDNIISHVSSLIYDCTNSGDVKADESYVGGIVGLARYGMIKNCENFCDVSSEDGKFAGGIAGLSALAIYECYMYGGVKGKAYVGGIAGKAENIGNCRSCAYMDMDGVSVKALGLVAGKAEGLLYGNLFVDTGYGAVDSVTLADQAMGMSYDELMAYEEMPEQFKNFTVKFIDEDVVVAQKSYRYGEEFPATDYPVLNVKEGEYVYWEDKDLSVVCRNVTVHAVRRVYVPSVSSSVDGERPDIVLGGDFYPNSILRVNVLQDFQHKEIDSVKQRELPDIHYVVTNIYPYELCNVDGFSGNVEIRAYVGSMPSNTYMILDENFNCVACNIQGKKIGSYLCANTVIPEKGYIITIEHVSRITVAMILFGILAFVVLLVVLRIFLKGKIAQHVVDEKDGKDVI